MKPNRVWSWSMIAACVLCLACGDDDDKQADVPAERSPILNLAAGQIAAYALSDTPNQDFVTARGRVSARVPAPRTTYARNVVLGGGARAAAVVSDPEITTTRRLAATALGATLDPAKELDTVTAQASIDALMVEVQKIAPAATSCNALPAAKAEACAIAFLILEVRRSEGSVLSTPDTGVPVPDAGTDAGTDAGPSLPSGAFACGTRDLTGAREVATSISASETWSGKLLIKGRVLVSGGAKITIAAGTQIFMDVDSSLEIGWNSNDASVFADGTALAPITFCAKTADKGFWEKIVIGNNVTSDSYLRNVLIAEGGGSEHALQLDADITIDNVQVVDSGKNGVNASDFKAGSQFLFVRGALGYPIVFETPGALARVPVGGTFAGNTTDLALVSFGTIDVDVTVHNLGIPFLQEQRLLQSMGTLTIDPGVAWRVKSDVTLELGWNSTATAVQINGSADKPVRFSAVDDISNWGGLLVGLNVASSSKIAYTEIQGGGKSRDSALQIDAPIKLDHVTLKKNLTGVAISEKGLAAGSTALTVSETQARPLTVENNGIFTLPVDSVLTGNTTDQIALIGGTWDANGTVSDLGIPYYINVDWYVRNSAEITIKPGTEFVLGADIQVDLAWNGGTTTITAVGTAAAPIKFSGVQDTAGYWTGLLLGYGARTSSRFDYIEISGAGPAGGASLKLDVNVPVTNSKFSKSLGAGIDKLSTITTDYTMGGNTFVECAANVSEHR